MHEPSVSVQVYTGQTGRPNQGTIAMCTRDHVSAATFMSSLTNDWSFLRAGESAMWLLVVGSILTIQRNECLRQMEGEWVLFIDDDMVWKHDTIGRLVRSWEETQAQFEEPVIMGGLCQRRGEPYDPTMYMRDTARSGKYRFLEKWDTDVVEVDATGLAFLLVPTTALSAIAGGDWPDKETRMMYEPPQLFRWVDRLGEDLRFCQDAKEAGCRIFVDTRVEIGHLAEVQITKSHYLAEISKRSTDEEEIVRAINDRVGLPTMSAQEAREMLDGG